MGEGAGTRHAASYHTHGGLMSDENMLWNGAMRVRARARAGHSERGETEGIPDSEEKDGT